MDDEKRLTYTIDVEIDGDNEVLIEKIVPTAESKMGYFYKDTHTFVLKS